MDDKQFEARMKKLKDSYDQKPSSFDVETFMATLKPKKKRHYQKALIWIISAASIFIIGILSAPYIKDNEEHSEQLAEEEIIQEDTSSETEKINNDPALLAWKERLREIYQSKREQARQELALSERQFNSLYYVQSAKMSLDFDMSLQFQPYLSQEYMDNAEEDMIQQLDSPKMMLEKLPQWENDPMSFINKFSEKIQALKEVYNTAINDPEIVNAAANQFLRIAEVNGKKQFMFDYAPIESELFEVLPADSIGFFEILKMEPYFYGGEFIYSPIETAKSGVILEKTLLSETYDHDRELIKSYYELIMMKLFKGGEDFPIRNSNGTYNEQFIEILNVLIAEQSVTKDIAVSILQEINATGQSQTLEELRFEDVWNNLLLQKYPL